MKDLFDSKYSISMAGYTPEQKAFVVEVFLKNNESYITTIRKFRVHFKLKSNEKVPDPKTVKNWTEKFHQSGSTMNKKPSGRPK